MSTLDPRRDAGVPYERFEELASNREESIDVALGAALIARDVYEDLDVARLLARFDELASPIVRLGLREMSAEAQALELAHYIYERQGFAGNEADYYDPKNSLLPDVLDRRLGFPSPWRSSIARSRGRAGVRPEGSASQGTFWCASTARAPKGRRSSSIHFSVGAFSTRRRWRPCSSAWSAPARRCVPSTSSPPPRGSSWSACSPT